LIEAPGMAGIDWRMDDVTAGAPIARVALRKLLRLQQGCFGVAAA
jgi:hypothetical protein